MPEARLAKARATLPEGYQFGVARDRETGIAMRYVKAFDIVANVVPARFTRFHLNDDGQLVVDTETTDAR